MRLKVNLSQPFNLDYTLNSGQTFRWRKIGDSWYGTIGSTAVKVTQTKNTLQIESDEKLGEEMVLRYFGLDDDLVRIYSSISKDSHIVAALKKYWGLRILKQDPWEAIFSFIAATNINIKRVEKTIHRSCARIGRLKMLNGVPIYTFPIPQAILRFGEDSLRAAGFGYRAPWLLKAAEVVVDRQDLLLDIFEQRYESARALLMQSEFKGIGEKAADCILLFGFHKLESFPIDRWIKRSILNNYAHLFDTNLSIKLKARRSLDRVTYDKIRKTMMGYFGRYAGYAQQYLFVQERSTNRSMMKDKD
jgi:N-glycosylase/DNA lyase